MLAKNLNYYIFLILAVGILSAAFHGLGFIKSIPWHFVYSDTLGFFDRVAAPGFAYISKPIEYPILTGLFIQLAGMVGKTRAGYYLASIAGLLAAATIATYFLYKILDVPNIRTPDVHKLKSQYLGHRESSYLAPKKQNLLRYWILAPSMLIFSTSNWDILAISLIAAAFYFLHKDKFYWGVFLLALSFSLKFYPILYLPILLLKKNRWQDWVKIIGIFIATTAILNGFFMIYHFNAWSYFYTLNTLRDPNPDSIWTIIRYFIWPFEVGTVNFLSFALFVGSYFYFIWKYRRDSMFKLCFIATMLFLLFNKVFSPQYILWLLPFFAIFYPPPKSWFYILEFSNLAAFFSILPWFFLGHDMFYFYLSVPFVLLRHIALFSLFFRALDRK